MLRCHRMGPRNISGDFHLNAFRVFSGATPAKLADVFATEHGRRPLFACDHRGRDRCASLGCLAEDGPHSAFFTRGLCSRRSDNSSSSCTLGEGSSRLRTWAVSACRPAKIRPFLRANAPRPAIKAHRSLGETGGGLSFEWRPAGGRQTGQASPGSGYQASAICAPPRRIGAGDQRISQAGYRSAG